MDYNYTTDGVRIKVSSSTSDALPQVRINGIPVSAEHYDYTPPIEEKKKSWLRQKLSGILAFIVAAAKWGVLILGKLKFLSVGLTMLISIAAYSLFWGWEFALGFVLLILVHEYGHVIQLRREGIHATAPRFIPFLGAYIGMKEMPKNALAEARVGIAGPIAGTLASMIPFGIWLATGSHFWEALAYIGFFLNLFNLIPVLPLDGARIASAISTKLWIVGFVGVLILAVATLNPILFIILFLGALELSHRVGKRRNIEHQRYHEVPVKSRFLMATSYISLVLITGGLMILTYVPKTHF